MSLKISWVFAKRNLSAKQGILKMIPDVKEQI